MPIGVLTDNLMVALGGIVGGMLGAKVSDDLKQSLTQVFGFAAIGIGVTLIVKVNTLGAVVLALILGTLVGHALRLEERIDRAFAVLNRRIVRKSEPDEAYMAQFTTLLVLCCCSGTGIFGAMNEAMTGDATTILCKAVLDFFTVLIFATILGKFTAVIAVPQMAILLLLFFCARAIMPWMTDELIRDFTAAGGIIELIIGFRILRLTKAQAVNTLPALLLIFPVSVLWRIIF